jgi:hypothetical protein
MKNGIIKEKDERKYQRSINQRSPAGPPLGGSVGPFVKNIRPL